MLTAVLFSCKKEDLQQEQSFELQSAGGTLEVAQATTPNSIFAEPFEGSSAFATYVRKQTGTSYGIGQSTSPLFGGSKVGRFELRDTDPEASGGTRTEVLFPEQTNMNRWYSFAAYFPSAQYKYDAADETICQWHQEGGTSASISLRTEKDRLILCVIPTYKGTSQKYDVGAIPKDKWNTIIMHAKHSPGSDGLIELWINGQKVANRTGGNMYSLSTSGVSTPRWKLGIYKSKWNGSSTTATNQRVLFVDNVKLGNENSTYEEVASAYTGSTSSTDPSGSTGTTDPSGSTGSTTAPSPITSFVLVNSDTESDVVTITNGATISLAKYGLKKANIRTNSSSAFSSVKFALSGKQSKTFTDNAAPYALHGDSGSGNFYYGNWNPPALGTYTLKATPYSGDNASGTAGTAASITFTIVQ
jgi:hypothetical protein